MAKKNEGHSLLIPAIAAIAGGYFLYGAKDAAKNRKKVKSWMLKAKAEVLERIESGNIATEEAYQATVDKIAAKYRALKGVDQTEVEAVIADLKKHWKGMVKAVAPKKK